MSAATWAPVQGPLERSGETQGLQIATSQSEASDSFHHRSVKVGNICEAASELCQLSSLLGSCKALLQMKKKPSSSSDIILT